MKIAMVSPEGVPFSKTGGLADVVGALPAALAREKAEVVTVLPAYKNTPKEAKAIPGPLRIPIADRYVEGRVLELRRGGRFLFIHQPDYFDREFLYRTPEGDYPDNDERFIFFCRGALEALKRVGFMPDILHCHDWQTGLLPAYLKTLYRIDAFFARTATVFTVHNIAYQGTFPKERMFQAGLGWAEFTPEKLEYYGQISFLKAGLVYADILNTVSPTYAKEIASSAEFGRGMEGVLARRAEDLFGVLNGLDTDVWNPMKDPHLPKRYGPRSMTGKAVCKQALRRELGLPEGDGAIVGMVTRLDPQKGLDLIQEAWPDLLDLPIQFVLLGTGDAAYMKFFGEVAGRHPEQAAVRLEFNEGLAHRIYAGSDIFLMPSRFEPCGLGQMIAMRYGAVPVVRKTGGLADTVDEKRGFLFEEPTADSLLAALSDALAQLRRPSDWKARMAAGMSADFSWRVSARAYLRLYRRALEHLPPP